MRNVTILTTFTIILAILTSCSMKPKEDVVNIVAKDFKFQVIDSIPSGWTTFRFKNEGHSVHFFLLDKLPDSITYMDYRMKAAKPFDLVMDSLIQGMSKEDALSLLVQLLPKWYFTGVKQMGGSGIIHMGDSIDVTLKLPPGVYAIECYIKEQGVFHTALGMIKKLVVTDQKSDHKPPLPNMELTLKNGDIETSGALNKGLNTFAVYYNEKPEGGLGNDVHIFKIDPKTNIDSVVQWMNWMNVTGLQSPAPATFYGGVQEMPVGDTSYFSVILDPGEYAYISETIYAKQSVKKFTVK